MTTSTSKFAHCLKVMPITRHYPMIWLRQIFWLRSVNVLWLHWSTCILHPMNKHVVWKINVKLFYITTMRKKGVCNWPRNSIFEFQKTLAINHIYMSWMLMHKLHELQSYNSPYIWCNSLQLNYNLAKITNVQLLCNSIITTLMLSYWCY
jgi:hypothetical protein